MTAADLLADDDFAGLVFQHWHVTGDERQRSGDPCFTPRTVGEDLLDVLLARESETFEVRPLKWMRKPCEVCGGAGGVYAFQNGRNGTHPCPRGCEPKAQYSDIVSDGGMDPRYAYEQARAAVTVKYDLSAAEVEGAIRDKLIELGWTPPQPTPRKEQHPMVNHPNRGQRTMASTPTPQEIRRARAKNGHTQKEAATIVFATERAWAEWEADRPDGYPGRNMHPAMFLLYRARTAPTAREKAAVLNGADGYVYGLGADGEEKA